MIKGIAIVGSSIIGISNLASVVPGSGCAIPAVKVSIVSYCVCWNPPRRRACGRPEKDPGAARVTIFTESHREIFAPERIRLLLSGRPPLDGIAANSVGFYDPLREQLGGETLKSQ